MTDFWSSANELQQSSTPFVVVTLVEVLGGAPQDPGAKALITAEGLHSGTVGGGKVEARAIEHARALLGKLPQVTPPSLLKWNLQKDIGMTCGGVVTFLFEVHDLKAWQIVVFGAGHVGQALVRTLNPLQCGVTCIDPRPEWIERLPHSAKLKKLCVSEPAAIVAELDPHAFFVVMTRGHATDVPILNAIFQKFPDAPYVGVMGSDIKAIRIRADLKALGVSEQNISRLRCPIGLALGRNAPSEIAISVAAELLKMRDGSRKT